MVYSEDKLREVVKKVEKKFGATGHRRIKGRRSAKSRPTFAADVDVAKVVRFVYKHT